MSAAGRLVPTARTAEWFRAPARGWLAAVSILWLAVAGSPALAVEVRFVRVADGV